MLDYDSRRFTLFQQAHADDLQNPDCLQTGKAKADCVPVLKYTRYPRD